MNEHDAAALLGHDPIEGRPVVMGRAGGQIQLAKQSREVRRVEAVDGVIGTEQRGGSLDAR